MNHYIALEEEIDQPPLLFIDVNLGEGRKPRITLYNGDKPEQVAAKFAREHSKPFYVVYTCRH